VVIVAALGIAGAITSYAQEYAIDGIVMGTRGRGAPGHLLLGSVAEPVVRTATCPVLTMHQLQESVAPGDHNVIAPA
jgi:nucleotide-binding universal stress UspA family protein